MLYFIFITEGKLDFATFLEIMHEHMQQEKCQQEILNAFRAQDRRGTGQLPVDEVVNLLRFGETLSQQESMYKQKVYYYFIIVNCRCNLWKIWIMIKIRINLKKVF